MQNSDKLFTRLVERNIDGLVNFIDRLAWHEGNYKITCLHRVVENADGTLSIRRGQTSDQPNAYAVSMGGEVVNSFSPLYEAAYFLQSLFLAGLATLFLESGRLTVLRGVARAEYMKRIREELLAVNEDELDACIREPKVAIISGLDTDIEPIRYGKHQLWRMSNEVLNRRVTGIRREHLNQTLLDESLRDIYWTGEDLDIAEMAIARSDTLPHAKAIQLYATLKRVLETFGINLAKIPFFFNFAPAEDIREQGPDSDFLQVLLGLHTPTARLMMRAITGRNETWIITIPCPNCGQSSKRVLHTDLRPNARVVRIKCQKGNRTFRNEMGSEFVLTGCGHDFEFEVPSDVTGLYQFFQAFDFSLYFPVRQLSHIIKSSVETPICLTTQDLGVIRAESGQLIHNPAYPKGYGDHIEMQASKYAMAFYFIEGLLAPQVSQMLKRQNLLMPKPMMILGFDRSSTLVDPSVRTIDGDAYVTDTSVLKAIRRGLTVEEIFDRSIWFHDFELPDLLSLRSTKNNSLEKVLQTITEQQASAPVYQKLNQQRIQNAPA